MDNAQKSGVNKLFSGKLIQGVFQTKEEKVQKKIQTHQNLIFNEVSRFVTHFINYALPYEQANQLLVDACDTFMIEKTKAHLLCTELRSN